MSKIDTILNIALIGGIAYVAYKGYMQVKDYIPDWLKWNPATTTKSVNDSGLTQAQFTDTSGKYSTGITSTATIKMPDGNTKSVYETDQSYLLKTTKVAPVVQTAAEKYNLVNTGRSSSSSNSKVTGSSSKSSGSSSSKSSYVPTAADKAVVKAASPTFSIGLTEKAKSLGLL